MSKLYSSFVRIPDSLYVVGDVETFPCQFLIKRGKMHSKASMLWVVPKLVDYFVGLPSPTLEPGDSFFVGCHSPTLGFVFVGCHSPKPQLWA